MSTEVSKDAARASKEAKRQQKHQTTSKHGSSVSITIHTSDNIRAYFGDACQLCRKPRPKGEPNEKQKIPPRMDIQICHVVSRTKSADYECVFASDLKLMRTERFQKNWYLNLILMCWDHHNAYDSNVFIICPILEDLYKIIAAMEERRSMDWKSITWKYSYQFLKASGVEGDHARLRTLPIGEFEETHWPLLEANPDVPEPGANVNPQVVAYRVRKDVGGKQTGKNLQWSFETYPDGTAEFVTDYARDIVLDFRMDPIAAIIKSLNAICGPTTPTIIAAQLDNALPAKCYRSRVPQYEAALLRFRELGQQRILQNNLISRIDYIVTHGSYPREEVERAYPFNLSGEVDEQSTTRDRSGTIKASTYPSLGSGPRQSSVGTVLAGPSQGAAVPDKGVSGTTRKLTT